MSDLKKELYEKLELLTKTRDNLVKDIDEEIKRTRAKLISEEEKKYHDVFDTINGKVYVVEYSIGSGTVTNPTQNIIKIIKPTKLDHPSAYCSFYCKKLTSLSNVADGKHSLNFEMSSERLDHFMNSIKIGSAVELNTNNVDDVIAKLNNSVSDIVFKLLGNE